MASTSGITRDLVLTVNGNSASLSESCYLYRGDRGITLNISIQQYKYKFNKKRVVENVINEDTSIVYARALVHSPKEVEGEHVYCFEVPVVHIINDTIEIPITAGWVDEITEVGTYKLQIQLYGEDPELQRISIPPVEFYVLEPMCELAEDFSTLGNAGAAIVDYAIIRESGEAYNANFANGEYNKISWNTGEVITAVRLNKLEDAMEYTITALVNKAEKDHTHENMLTSMSCDRVEFVTEYPAPEDMEEDVLYILVERV